MLVYGVATVELWYFSRNMAGQSRYSRGVVVVQVVQVGNVCC